MGEDKIKGGATGIELEKPELTAEEKAERKQQAKLDKRAREREGYLKILPENYANMPDGYWELKKRADNAIKYAPKYGREEDVLVLLNMLLADANARLKPLLEDEDHG